MEKIRIGNDIIVVWNIYTDVDNEVPYDLSGRNLSLYMKTDFEKVKIESFVVEDNTIRFTYHGKEQNRPGKYTLTLVENEGLDGMHTVDECDAFELVRCSCDAGGDKESKIEIITLDLNTKMSVGPVGPKGDKGDKGEKGDKGDKGEKGETGEPGASNTHNIGSIELFEQIIAERRNHNLTQEDKDAILNGKIITTSVGNGVVPTISSNSMGENGAVLIFHFNERLYEMFVMWTDTLCYINGVFSFAKETKLYADSELSETSENAVQNKVVTEQLTELSAEIEVLKEAQQFTDVAVKDLQDMKIDREADDYYPKMAVGLADNLAGVDVVDSEINFRRSGGGAISDGVARIESIKGNSVVWNQVIDNTLTSAFRNGNANATLSADGGTYTLTATAAGSVYFYYRTQPLLDSLIVGHKYLRITECRKSSAAAAYVRLSGLNGDTDTTINVNDAWTIVSNILTITEKTNASPYYQFIIMAAAVGDSLSIRNVGLIDLTKMFGAGYEPTTIEEFYARIPMGVDLYAYNEGEVIHMDVQSIESQGVNAWDEEWEAADFNDSGLPVASTSRIASKNFIQVLPNTQYYIHSNVTGNDISVLFYNSDKAFISQTSWIGSNTKHFVTPANAFYVKFKKAGTTYNHDICINLSDTSINGKYYPYIKRVEDLSIIRKYFPEGMKSAGSAHDEIRYNKASGKKEHSKGRLKSVDLGTLIWQKNDTFGGYFAQIATAKTEFAALCAAYTYVGAYSKVNDKECGYVYNNYILIKDSSYTDVASFTEAMQGVILYYEAAEWEWVELDEADQFKDLDYQVWNAGTEKAIAEGKSAPLAADITYGFNSIGKIKELESLVAQLRAKVGI